MVPWGPLLPASLPTSAVKKAGIVLLVHKPQCPGEGLVRGPGNPLMWSEQSRRSAMVLEWTEWACSREGAGVAIGDCV